MEQQKCQNYSQLYDQNDILLILINLMKIDDVIVLHLRQYVNLLLNISHSDPTSRAFNPLLLYILCSVLSPARLTRVSGGRGRSGMISITL